MIFVLLYSSFVCACCTLAEQEGHTNYFGEFIDQEEGKEIELHDHLTFKGAYSKKIEMCLVAFNKAFHYIPFMVILDLLIILPIKVSFWSLLDGPKRRLHCKEANKTGF